MRVLSPWMLLLAIGVQAQQPGTLDPTFDSDGWRTIAVHGFFNTDYQRALVLMRPAPDPGTEVAFMERNNGDTALRVVKLLENGALDPSFADDGMLTDTTLGLLRDMIVLPDGSTLLVGQNRGAVFPDSLEIALEQYTPAGTLDAAFGTGGRTALAAPGTLPARINSAVRGPDGKVFIGTAAGTCCTSVDGSLDTAFGTNGWVIVPGVNIRLTPTQRIRSQSSGLTEFDYDGQTIPVNAVCNGSADGFRGYLHEVNCFGASAGFASFLEDVEPGEGPSSGMLTVAPPVPPHIGTLYQAYTLWKLPTSALFGYVEYYTGYVGAIAADPSGDLYLVYEINDTNEPWDLPHGWVLRKKRATGSNYDETFGDYSSSNSWAHGVITDFNGIVPHAWDAFVQGDGKLLVTGTAGDSIYVARYIASPDPRTSLAVELFLGGAYDPATGLMRDDLRQQGLLPTLQPSQGPRYVPANGVGDWAMPTSVLAVQGPDAVVDWVWLELLSAADSSTVVATRVGLLHRTGAVTAGDGHSSIDFSAGAGSYFVRVRHRNHLGVTTAHPVALSSTTTTLDLSDPTTPTWGTDAQLEVNGVRMLWPGDVNGDRGVKYVGAANDRDPVLLAIGGLVPSATVNGYRVEDVNLDGVVKYVGAANDRDLILQTIGPHPSTVRHEQRP